MRIGWFSLISAATLYAAPANLAEEAVARSWQTTAAVAEHEPAKVNDGSLHTYWMVRPENIPADIGLEWAAPRKLSSLVVRYFDGRMARGAAAARTQQGASIEAWIDGGWHPLRAGVIGQETASVRYTFEPVTTTRIRLLFREPPDPEQRRFPDRLGIYVCEMEAYQDVPFRLAPATGRIEPAKRPGGYLHFYNEPPAGDGHYNPVGPLIIEPKPSRIFRDVLAPTLIVHESPWASQPCLAEQSPTLLWLSNGFLQVQLATKPTLQETGLVNLTTDDSAATPDSRGFVLRGEEREWTAADFTVRSVDTAGSNDDAARARIELVSSDLAVSVHYELRRHDHFARKWLVVENLSGKPLRLMDVSPSWFGLRNLRDLMAGQELTYPVALRERGGFFAALETPYWDHQGDRLTYYPGVILQPGGRYESDKAAVGVFRNRKENVAGWDRGVREWITEYHARISPVTDVWPEVYCEGWTANLGLKEMRDKPQWVERWMDTAQKLGIHDMDAYEPFHQVKTYAPEIVKRFVDLATAHGIRTGFWFDFGADNAWHGTVVPMKPTACKLSPEAERQFREVLELVKKHGLKAMHWADFFTVWPCEENGHDHLPGKYSVYAQGQRMLRFGRELREASPGITLGGDGGFSNPQFVRHSDGRGNAWFVDPADRFAAIEPDIHIDRLTAGRNIPYVYGSYLINLAPWFRILNWVNHMGYETNQHDRAGYRYGLLAALAMAGQVTFNGVPDAIPESEIAFTRHWLGWARENRDFLKQADRLFDRSARFADIWQGDADSLAGFAHLRGDRGFVFLLNPSPVEHRAEFTLALGGPAGQRLEAREIYPSGQIVGTGLRNGEVLRVRVPGKQVRVLWIRPSTGTPAAVPVSEPSRYVSDWTLVSHTALAARVGTRFAYPSRGAAYLAAKVAEAEWRMSPWAFEKAYLVLLLKDETGELNDNFLPDDLAISATVNGVSKKVYPFKTRRYQAEGATRCYFLELGAETLPGGQNSVTVELPVRGGLVFSGAYLDLPDQMP
jgi:hypothetical protein